MRSAWADWLKAYHWDYFLTSTFRSARREPYYALKHVWNELKKHNVARAFLGAEPFRTGDLHIHGIVAGAYSWNYDSFIPWKPGIDLPWDIWQGLFKRFGRAKVEACNSSEAVTAYCAKYVLKEQRRADHYEVFGESVFWAKSG